MAFALTLIDSLTTGLSSAGSSGWWVWLLFPLPSPSASNRSLKQIARTCRSFSFTFSPFLVLLSDYCFFADSCNFIFALMSSSSSAVAAGYWQLAVQMTQCSKIIKFKWASPSVCVCVCVQKSFRVSGRRRRRIRERKKLSGIYSHGKLLPYNGARTGSHGGGL